MTLPLNIQTELVSEWKSQKFNDSCTNKSTTQIRNIVSTKRKQSDENRFSIGKKNKLPVKGTLDSFFSKK